MTNGSEEFFRVLSLVLIIEDQAFLFSSTYWMDALYVWAIAEIALMGPEGKANLLFKNIFKRF